MKILHSVASLDVKHGGVTNAVLTFVKVLNSHSFDNTVVSFDASSLFNKSDLSFEFVPLGLASNSWRYNPNFKKWCFNNVLDYDVIFVHGLWLYNFYCLVKVLKSFKKKGYKVPLLYVVPHGMLDPWFQSFNLRPFKTLRNYIYWLFVERPNIKFADLLLFTSDNERNNARETFSFYSPKREYIVGLGIEQPILPTSSKAISNIRLIGLDQKDRYFLFLSRIDEKKGVDILIDAYIQFKIKYLDAPLLVIVGPGIESNYGRYIKNIASVSCDIIFSDILLDEYKWSAFCQCECFILPSHQENFGIVVVEALSCSKPVLISDKVNIYNDIVNSNSGLVFLDSKESVFKALCEWYCLEKKDKDIMSSNAYDLYEKKFSLNAFSRSLLEILQF